MGHLFQKDETFVRRLGEAALQQLDGVDALPCLEQGHVDAVDAGDDAVAVGKLYNQVVCLGPLRAGNTRGLGDGFYIFLTEAHGRQKPDVHQAAFIIINIGGVAHIWRRRQKSGEKADAQGGDAEYGGKAGQRAPDFPID